MSRSPAFRDNIFTSRQGPTDATREILVGPNGTYLPPIRTTYDDSFQGVRTTYRRREDDSGDPNRLRELESRLELQEKTSQQLLDRAVRVKQDLMENLTYTKGTWQEEKEARELLQEHVRTITAVVRQMNKEIKTLESEVKEKDTGIHTASDAVKNLEGHHVAGITDLRGRVARCDAAIGKLASDLKQTNESVRTYREIEHADVDKFNEKIQRVETQLVEINGRLERVSMENSVQVKQTGEEISKYLYDVDARTRAMLEELRHQIETMSHYANSEIEKLESRIENNIQKSVGSRDIRMEKLETEHREFYKQMNERLSILDKDHNQYKTHVAKIHKDLDSRLAQYADSVYRQQSEDLLRLKREMREGFATVHETVNSMKSVVEGKQKLLEESLRREIGQIRKMVVLI